MNKEKFLKGILGGFVGSLVGVIAILFFYKLGYVAAVAGLLMAACTISLYQKFAGGIDKKGIIACIIIMIVMTIVGNNLAFTFALVDELKTYYDIEGDFMHIFFNLYSLMSEGLIETSTYVGDLIMILLFNIMGAVGVLKNQFKQIKVSTNNNNQVNYNNANYTNTTFNNSQNNINNNNIPNNPNYNYNNMNNQNLNNNNSNLTYEQNPMNNNLNNNSANIDNSGFNQNNTNGNIQN